MDLLKLMGIEPDGMIGHSLGEIGCAYADGAFTLEEAIMVSYWRGKCLLDLKLPKRAMAAVGEFLEKIPLQIPSSITLHYNGTVYIELECIFYFLKI